jgi:hypothetical protein
MHNAEDNDQRDDFMVEVTDLPPEESYTISSALLDLGLRFVSRVRSLNIKISWQARDEDEYTSSSFDLRISDLPLDEIASTSSRTAASCSIPYEG